MYKYFAVGILLLIAIGIGISNSPSEKRTETFFKLSQEQRDEIAKTAIAAYHMGTVRDALVVSFRGVPKGR